MADRYVGFIDAGVLRSRRREHFRPQGRVIVDWFRNLATTVSDMEGERFLRVYWYDGRHAPDHSLYASQDRFFVGREEPQVSI